MAKKLYGQPNQWADDFYRLTEDFVYVVIKLEEYRKRLINMNLEKSTIEDLIDSMTNPPPIDYSAPEDDSTKVTKLWKR